jgi:hypothetical protein
MGIDDRLEDLGIKMAPLGAGGPPHLLEPTDLAKLVPDPGAGRSELAGDAVPGRGRGPGARGGGDARTRAAAVLPTGARAPRAATPPLPRGRGGGRRGRGPRRARGRADPRRRGAPLDGRRGALPTTRPPTGGPTAGGGQTAQRAAATAGPLPARPPAPPLAPCPLQARRAPTSCPAASAPRATTRRRAAAPR